MCSILTLVSPCLQPGLPNSAVCALCGAGQGKQECSDASPSSTTLMECSNCAQIAHPDCIKVTRPRTSRYMYSCTTIHMENPSCATYFRYTFSLQCMYPTKLKWPLLMIEVL